MKQTCDEEEATCTIYNVEREEAYDKYKLQRPWKRELFEHTTHAFMNLAGELVGVFDCFTMFLPQPNLEVQVLSMLVIFRPGIHFHVKVCKHAG